MTADVFSPLPQRHPVCLIDLVETKTPEENHAFLGWVTQIAEAAGGRVAIANEAKQRETSHIIAGDLNATTWLPLFEDWAMLRIGVKE